MPKPRIFEVDAETLRRRFAESEAAFAVSSDSIRARWGPPAGTSKGGLTTLHDAIRQLLTSPTQTGFGGTDLFELYRHFLFGAEIGRESNAFTTATYAIWRVTGSRELVPPEEVRWVDAYDMGRAMVSMEPEHPVMWFERVACKYAQKLKDHGYSLTAARGGYIFDDGEIERATAALQSRLDKIGLFESLRGITMLMLSREQTGFGIYLFARHSSTKERLPACPYGFLLNLALRCPVVSDLLPDRSQKLAEALELATEITAALDLETFLQPAGVLVDAPRIEIRLRKEAQFDHLFAFRQWPIPYVDFLLRNFFTSDLSDWMLNTFGWNVSDALTLWNWLTQKIGAPFPWTTTKSEIAQCGVPKDRFEPLLAALAHPSASVNVNYRSPLTASETTAVGMMAFLRPLIALDGEKYLIPVPSASGPAFYEALMVPVWKANEKAAEKLVGDGTERVVVALLKKVGVVEPLHNKIYALKSPSEDGQMDVVYETNNLILIFECKAKALTRKAMAGIPAEAMLDFAAGVVDSQVQALRHERILRQRSTINFDNGGKLEWRRRKIIRVSVTMLDLGCMQDTSLLWGFIPALIRATVSTDANHPKLKQVKALNGALQQLREETAILESIGVPFADQRSRTFAFSAGQLVTILSDAGDVEEFVRSISKPVVFGTLNPILDYLLRKQLAQAAPVAGS